MARIVAPTNLKPPTLPSVQKLCIVSNVIKPRLREAPSFDTMGYMIKNLITTEGLYTKGVIVPKVKPSGRRIAIVTFLPIESGESIKSDEEIWEGIQPTARKIRKQLFRKTYPDFYEETEAKGRRRRA